MQIQLPIPDQYELEHSQRLCNRIKEAIYKNNGYIDFATFMQISMYEPGLGYYSSGTRKLGVDGDFITAPEISTLFIQCLARQLTEVLSVLEQPSIIEFGPGSGEMCCNLLSIFDQQGCLPDNYYLMEISADLRERQERLIESRIPHLAKRVTWLDTLPDRGFNGIILGNEVIDAMPVHRLIMQDGMPFEYCVGLKDEKFHWQVAELENGISKNVHEKLGRYIQHIPDGYITEFNNQILPWLVTMAEILECGIMIFIDYGYPRQEYYHPQRIDGTLLCHYRHHVHGDPFLYPGLQDITASVDFTAIAEAAVDSGMQVRGYTTQAHFLMDCGLCEFMQINDLNCAAKRVELSNQARLLTMPGEMGELFKVIALTKKIEIPLIGFKNFDHRSRL
jgi:SAM-dependent MidA family methyltransferase